MSLNRKLYWKKKNVTANDELAESIGCHMQISHQPWVFKTNFWGGYYPLHFLVLRVGDNL